jgi:hypothetical protein
VQLAVPVPVNSSPRGLSVGDRAQSNPLYSPCQPSARDRVRVIVCDSVSAKSLQLNDPLPTYSLGCTRGCCTSKPNTLSLNSSSLRFDHPVLHISIEHKACIMVMYDTPTCPRYPVTPALDTSIDRPDIMQAGIVSCTPPARAPSPKFAAQSTPTRLSKMLN